jgi:hypothetical protein
MSAVSTVLAEARGFKRHPLAPDPRPRSLHGTNMGYDHWKSSAMTVRMNGGRSGTFTEAYSSSNVGRVSRVWQEPK